MLFCYSHMVSQFVCCLFVVCRVVPVKQAHSLGSHVSLNLIVLNTMGYTQHIQMLHPPPTHAHTHTHTPTHTHTHTQSVHLGGIDVYVSMCFVRICMRVLVCVCVCVYKCVMHGVHGVWLICDVLPVVPMASMHVWLQYLVVCG